MKILKLFLWILKLTLDILGAKYFKFTLGVLGFVMKNRKEILGKIYGRIEAYTKYLRFVMKSFKMGRYKPSGAIASKAATNNTHYVLWSL